MSELVTSEQLSPFLAPTDCLDSGVAALEQLHTAVQVLVALKTYANPPLPLQTQMMAKVRKGSRLARGRMHDCETRSSCRMPVKLWKNNK